jgi:dihydrofolate synthase/folylpolyglutamate synthase
MNYQESLDFLFTQLPMFQRQGAAAYKADLSNTLAICKAIGNPEKDFKSIHIAGTNGKGSTSHILASILQECGLKVGLYTSPHLFDFRERIRINGEMINQEAVVEFVSSIKDNLNEVKPSFFELTFAMAMKYFKSENIDIAVIETGMGGRLDSTNVVKSILSIITNIGLDHTQFLGDSIEKIAMEKAGIIKRNIPVVIGRKQKEIKDLFIEKAKSSNSEIYFSSDLFQIESQKTDNNLQCFDINALKSNIKYKKLCSDFLGEYQSENILTVLTACEVLNSNKLIEISTENIFKGILNAIKNTGFFGRWSVISQKPLTVCDTAHNEDGVLRVISQIKKQKYDKLHIVLGFVNDKNIDKILDLFPKEAHYYYCQANIPRALDVDILEKKMNDLGFSGNSYQSVRNAILSAKESSSEADMIFIGGSTFVVAELEKDDMLV